MSNKQTRRPLVESLPCKLTEQEKLEAGQRLAEALGKREAIQFRLDQYKAQMKSELAAQDAIVGKQSSMISSGIEYRDVKCIEIRDFTEGLVIIERETGERVRERVMREDERQMELRVPDPANIDDIDEVPEEDKSVAACKTHGTCEECAITDLTLFECKDGVKRCHMCKEEWEAKMQTKRGKQAELALN